MEKYNFERFVREKALEKVGITVWLLKEQDEKLRKLASKFNTSRTNIAKEIIEVALKEIAPNK